ncbi:hypothetical protein KC19_VG269600 [Ceratodon purpureus]|uniref:Uncharacterized protein n=1 Tax=Ceratodon purpureus TaxID=3225 RepID=A0A8T0HUZ0_CERPU|nr:hypothetical protein KC19_VG269600 [Ceratodon purpureus]
MALWHIDCKLFSTISLSSMMKYHMCLCSSFSSATLWTSSPALHVNSSGLKASFFVLNLCLFIYSSAFELRNSNLFSTISLSNILIITLTCFWGFCSIRQTGHVWIPCACCY